MRAAAALTLGLANAAAFAPATHWAFGLAVLIGLFALMRDAARRGTTPLGQAVLGMAFGMGGFTAGLSWLYVSMHDYGGMPSPMAAAAVVLFAAYLSLYPAAAAWLAWRTAGHRGPLRHAVSLAGAWTLCELARGSVLTGFPWLAIGYAQIDGPVDRMAPILGVYGVGGVAAAVAALCAVALVPQRPGGEPVGTHGAAAATRWVAGGSAAALLLACWMVPREGWTVASGTPLQVRLIQGNVPQEMKFRPERTLAAMHDYTAGFEAGTASLTILPETAWTVPWERTPEAIAQRLLDHVTRGHALAIGLPALVPGSDGGRPHLANSVLMLKPGRTPDPRDPTHRYDKQHLVPFGEFVPWGFRWFVDLMHIPLGDFARGGPDQRPFEVGGQRIAFNICYEDLFGEEIRLALLGPNGATVLANVSNIAWFGRSHALPQHLGIARMRSLETGRPMLRATNTGTTAAIDAQGRVTAQLTTHVADTLDVSVQGTVGLTPYARLGNLPVIVLSVLAILAAALPWARSGVPRQSR